MHNRKRSYSYSYLNQIFSQFTVFKRLLFLSFTLILSGCASFTNQMSTDDTVTQQWQFNGKFAIKTPTEKNAAKMHWAQLNDQFEINLYTLFGISLMNIQGDAHRVAINSNGDTYTGNNAQELIYRLTRWHIPVNDIPAWVTGHVENAIDVQLDAQGNFHKGTIIGDDNTAWQLTLSHYKTVDDVNRPHQLLLKSADGYFKLAITQWNIQY